MSARALKTRRQSPARPAWVAAALLLGACTVGPDFVRPDAPKVTRYTAQGDPAATAQARGTAQHFSPGTEVPRAWWKGFGSAELDATVDEALVRNPGLEAAQASLKAAQDNLRSGYGVFFPQIGGDFGASRELYSPLRIGQSGTGNIFNLFTLTGTIGYALDVFGGERRNVEALGAERDVQSAEAEAARLALAANVANTAIAGAAYRAEINAMKDLIALERQHVGLAEDQARAGTQSYAPVLALQSALAAQEASIPALEQKEIQADDLLATLAGHAPAEWQAPPMTLDALTLPADLPVSLPSALVRQRPDIVAAEAQAHAASAEIGVATAAMLPDITLSGSYGAASSKMDQLLAMGGNTWSLGADVAQPIFEGGTLWFKRKAAVENYRQAMALYRQTVLAAFDQVADTLRALDHDAETLKAEERSLAAAQGALHLATANYRAGLATYLDVLIADEQYHQAVIAELQAVAVRYQDTVALYAALGGGWQPKGAATAAAAD